MLYLCGHVHFDEMDKESKKFVSVFPKTTKFLKIGLKWFFNDNIRQTLSCLSSEFDSKSDNTFYHLQEEQELCLEQMRIFFVFKTFEFFPKTIVLSQSMNLKPKHFCQIRFRIHLRISCPSHFQQKVEFVAKFTGPNNKKKSKW